jgi:hypothetical protein
MGHKMKCVMWFAAFVSFAYGGYLGAFLHEYSQATYNVAVALWLWEMGK